MKKPDYLITEGLKHIFQLQDTVTIYGQNDMNFKIIDIDESNSILTVIEEPMHNDRVTKIDPDIFLLEELYLEWKEFIREKKKELFLPSKTD